MREVDDDTSAEETLPEADVDLRGVTEALHEVLTRIVAAEPSQAERELEAARQVSVNKDGSVIVRLSQPVKVGEEEHDRFRLRPMKARDYFDGTIGQDAQDYSLEGSLRFAARLAKPSGVVEELLCMRDAKAAWYGVMAARKNFSSPKP